MEHLSNQEVELTTNEVNSITKEVDLIVEVEFLNDEVEKARADARGKGVQVSFRIFCQLVLQLHSDFNIKALKALVTLEVVG